MSAPCLDCSSFRAVVALCKVCTISDNWDNLVPLAMERNALIPLVTIKDEYERIMAIRGAKNLLDAHGTLRLKLDAFYS